MRALIVILLTYLVVGLESPLLHRLEVSLYAPNLALIAVIFAAWAMPGLDGLIAAFVIGLLHDGFAMGAPVGMHTEISVLVFLALRFPARRMSLQSPIPLMALTVIASVISSALFFLLSAIFDRQFGSFGLIFSVMVPNALVTAPFAPLLFPLYSWASERFAPRRGRELYFS
jgi:rod shape-determining protein MreD